MKSRLPKGMGGGPRDMSSVIRQAQKMQEQMTKKQEELAEKEYTATSGGGMVEITMNGKKEVRALHIKPEAVDPEDIEMLEDLISAAVNEVIRVVEEDSSTEMEKISGSISLPGMPGGFGL